jgi:threonine dehydratase
LIAPHVRRTPVLRVDGADFGLDGVRLVLKLEFMQHAGSFKTRGAFTNLLTRPVPAAGVAAASGGNHGAAVAYAAKRLGYKARIFVPEISSPAKIARIRSYGADLAVGGKSYAEALAACDAHVAETGALSVHAFDQDETMLGQGTVGQEMEEQVPDLDTLLVAVGGGGLIGGIASWYEGRVKIVGVEPHLAPTLAMALAAGAPVNAPTGSIAADSLAPRQIGALVFPIVHQHVAACVLVEDAAIAKAQQALWDMVRIAAEPGAAAPMAALLSGAYAPAKGERVGVLVSGANTTAVSFDL